MTRLLIPNLRAMSMVLKQPLRRAFLVPVLVLAVNLTGCMCRDWITEGECLPGPRIENAKPLNPSGRKAAVVAAHVTPAPGMAPADSSARNSVYLELLGNGGVYSFNFEREILPHLGLRIGAATWEDEGEGFFGSTSTHRHITFPLMLNYGMGGGNSRLELGGGLLLGQSKRTGYEERTTSGFLSLTASIGYRYQRPRGGVLFRAGLTPFYSLDSREDAYPDAGLSASLGMSIGYAF